MIFVFFDQRVIFCNAFDMPQAVRPWFSTSFAPRTSCSVRQRMASEDLARSGAAIGWPKQPGTISTHQFAAKIPNVEAAAQCHELPIVSSIFPE